MRCSPCIYCMRRGRQPPQLKVSPTFHGPNSDLPAGPSDVVEVRFRISDGRASQSRVTVFTICPRRSTSSDRCAVVAGG